MHAKLNSRLREVEEIARQRQREVSKAILKDAFAVREPERVRGDWSGV